MNKGEFLRVEFPEDSLLASVKGKRVGLMVNGTAINNDGKMLIDVLYESGVCEIAFILGMEHGVRCEYAAGEHDSEGVDKKTGISIIDLYSYPERRPPVDALRTVDAVVYCAQDAGVRHWTFTPWMFYLLDAAEEAGCAVIVVDRPNPIGGEVVEGNLVEDKYKNTLLTGFGYPLRHGMTSCELALMYKEEQNLRLDLKLLTMSGWKREMFYSDTGYLWQKPTPNINHPESFLDFATTGLLQSTNLSLGDHTGLPFKYVGRPEISGEQLACELNGRGLRDVWFEPKDFVSSTRWEKDVLFNSGGVIINYLDKRLYRPIRAQLHLIDALAKLYYDKIEFEYKPSWARKRMGTDDIYTLLSRGESVLSLAEKWQAQSESFFERRKPYLLYS